MSTRPLRLVAVTGTGSLGGSERWLVDLLHEAGPRAEAEVWMLAEGPLRGVLEARGVPVTVLPTGRTGGAVLGRAGSLVRRLRRSGADVVLANGVKAAAAVVPACRLAGVPVCWAKHDFSWDRHLAPVLGRLSTTVLATSAAVAGATRRADAVLVPPPRPPAAADREQALSSWTARGVPVGGPLRTLAVVGRLVGYKGVDTAVRALAAGADGWRLVVVGGEDPAEPEERARLEQLAAAADVADRVHLVGAVEDAGRLLAAFDAVAVLTRQEGHFGREGYSLVALEALAAGVPLVGAEGNPEVVRMAEVAGAVVPVDDPAALAGTLRSLEDDGVRRAAAARGRQLVADHPDAAACAGLVLQALARAAGRPGAALAGPPLTVLSCFKDEQGNVDGVVSRVLAQLGPDDEYLLVEDHSSDATPEELARWEAKDARVRVLPGPGVNLSAARNAGFAAASCSVVACTDAGCLPADDWLDALRGPFAEPDPPDLVVGTYDVDRGDPVRDAASVALFPRVAEARRATPLVRLAGALTGRRFSASRLDGRSMACSRAAWQRTGGFDETLFSSEDAVFGERLLAAGGTSVLALDATVTWEQDGSLRAMARMYHRYGEWGGRAGSWRLVGRDVARGAAYVVGPALLAAGGPRTRTTVLAAAAAYTGVPALRGRGEDLGPAGWALVPVLLATKDVAKATGCLRGLAHRVRGRDGG